MPERTPAQLLIDIECAIKPFVEQHGGKLDVASSLEHALEKLGTKPSSWRVVLVWDGYGTHTHGREGMSSVNFTTFIHANLGLAKNAGSKVYKESVNGELPFLDRVEQVSAWCRALRWPNGTNVDHAGMVLENSEWVLEAPEGSTAHALQWSVVMALPYFDKTIPITL